MNIYQLIDANYDRLSKKERLIADFLIEIETALLDYSIIDLAKAVGVSASTVTRFCQKLYLKSYSELKTLVLVANPHKEDYINETFAKNELFQTYLDLLQRTNNLLDNKLVNRLARDITNSRQVVIICLDSLKSSAQGLKESLDSLGVKCSASYDMNTLDLAQQAIAKYDLALIINQEKLPKEALSILYKIKKETSKIYSITNIKRTDISAITGSNTFYSYTNELALFNKDISTNFIIEYILMVLSMHIAKEKTP